MDVGSFPLPLVFTNISARERQYADSKVDIS
jgi:hypothetical protein